MNFDFSEDQKQLRDQARRFLTEQCPPSVVRTVLEGREPYAKALWKGIAEMGFIGAAVPEEFGGVGLGYLELCVIAEEMGRAVAPVPFASTAYLAIEALMLAGTEAQKKAWLPRLAGGAAIGCFAAAEGARPLSPRAVTTTFKSGALSGRKVPVTDGDIADVAIVLARSGDGSGERGLSLALVDLSASDVTRETVRTLDPTRGHAALAFDGAKAELIGAEGEGWALARQIMDRAAVLYAFEQVGGADACLEMARGFALDRYAFGRPIGSFQAIKHKLADMYVNTELARSNAFYGAWALSTGAPELAEAAAGARIAATEAYHYAAKENVQTHGGMGFTWEVDCQLHFRRARHLGLVLGAQRVWKDRLVTELERRNAA